MGRKFLRYSTRSFKKKTGIGLPFSSRYINHRKQKYPQKVEAISSSTLVNLLIFDDFDGLGGYKRDRHDGGD